VSAGAPDGRGERATAGVESARRGSASNLRRGTAIDLYAGAGGLSLGLEQAGFDVLVAVELDPIHALVHKYNFPTTPVLCRSVSEVSGADLVALAKETWAASGSGEWPGIDVVAGGPPCQGFSVGGLQELSDPRNAQLSEFARIVEEVKPASFILENVPGLFSPRFKPVVDGLIRRFERAGYHVSGRGQILDARDFGVPQMRRRVLLVGTREGIPTPVAPVPNRRGWTVADALDGLPDPVNYRRLLRSDSANLGEVELARYLNPRSEYARRLVGAELDETDLSTPREWDRRYLTSSLRTVHSAIVRRRFSVTLPGQVERRSRYYRLDSSGVSRTLRAGTGVEKGAHTSPRPIHPTSPRVVTVREAARIQGFPDWFRFHGTNWHGHRQVGNSVPPPLARAVAMTLLEPLALRPIRSEGASVLGDPRVLTLSHSEAIAELGLDGRSYPARRIRAKTELFETSPGRETGENPNETAVDEIGSAALQEAACSFDIVDKVCPRHVSAI
jgi:DNA (cytosine-5)-methyltransferase 1